MSNFIIAIILASIIIVLMIIGDYIESNSCDNEKQNKQIFEEKFNKLICNNKELSLEMKIKNVSKNAIILRNLILSKNNYDIIDYLVIDNSGIYCIKSSKWNSNIIGNFNASTLIQYSLTDKIKNDIPNPFFNNDKNISLLKSILSVDSIYNCFIVNGEYDIKNLPKSSTYLVGDEDKFINLFRQNRNKNILSKRDIKHIKNQLTA